MSNSSRLMFIHALSPVHAGTGQSLGAVDLAIARDQATKMPVMPGSGIKGALRDKSRHLKREDTVKLFGPETSNASDHAGGLIFGDGNLLCLPVRSIAGTFAWVTSPLLLLRFKRDCSEAGVAFPDKKIPQPEIERCSLPSSTSSLVLGDKKRVVFEDLDFSAIVHDGVEEIAKFIADSLFPADQSWQDLFMKKFCIVNDDVMSFLSQHATEVVTRVSLDPDTKTAKDSQLWTEESLPVETILVSLVAVQLGPDAQLGALEEIAKGSTQFGGKATIGRGRVRLTFSKGAR